MSLQTEIDSKRKEIQTESYPMSIGELMSLYTEGEMDIHPEFQRFFRWTPSQKSRFIESILLGIPIPSIFVSQRPDGVWDVIDGLQRLSTIFEFAGILKDEDEELITPSVMEATDYLPTLEGKKYNDPEDKGNSLDQVQRLIIKRSRLDVSIILKESDPDTKFELFQRLNTGGTKLEDQEIRNCILVMLNRNFYLWLKETSQFEPFQGCLPLTERAMEEQYDMELALRFFVYRKSSIEEINSIKDISVYITEKMIELAKDPNFDYPAEKGIFHATFQVLYETLGEDTFKKYYQDQERFKGAFSVSAYEVIAPAIGKAIEHEREIENDSLIDKIKSIWNNPIFLQRSGSGKRASERLPHLIPYGEELFVNENQD